MLIKDHSGRVSLEGLQIQNPIPLKIRRV
ncbi:unnamed protein product [Larinioides sclopetarius]|uniref:Uncharacterized protein n=1 Tax=Larinioides sclopetarius TaxID=280406 RepID=A0AAV1ZCI4_9ARAC